jgi:hypothetical protein
MNGIKTQSPMGKDRGEGVSLPDSDEARKIVQDPRATEKCTWCLQLFNVRYQGLP